MTTQTPYAFYGTPPAELAAPRADALQYSPLLPHSHALEDVPAASIAGMTMVAPPGTAERRYALAMALQALAEGAVLTVMAPKDKGGTRLKKELVGFGCVVEDVPRSHWRICTAVRPAQLSGIAEAVAEGAPRFDDALGLWTQPGVFSWNRVDAGSALLAANLPPLAGKGADLGAGIGYLARAVLTSDAVTQLTLVELDRRATLLAARNVEDARAQVVRADIRLGVPEASALDFVVMNPPFHDGGQEDVRLGLSFIQAASKLLRSGGVCWMVANRHLPYEGLLESCFARVVQHTQENGFKVYEAVK